MVEKVCLHIGQAGVQLGYSLWNLLSYEEGITKDGYDNFSNEDCIHDVCFQETYAGKWVPRALFVDSETVVIDEKIQGGSLGKMFAEEFSVTTYEDSGNNYARGRFYNYMEMQEDAMIAVRRLSEQCEQMTSFSQFGSINGGTGSGTCVGFLTTLSDMFPKILTNAHSIISSVDTVDIITQPYNNVLALANGNELIDTRFCYDNETMGMLIRPILRTCHLPVAHENINHIMSLVWSTLTSSIRWLGSDEERQMGINLTPFPQLSLNIPALVPLTTKKSRALLSEYTITYDAFLSNHEMTNVDFLNVSERYVSCCLIYRGDVKLKQVQDAIYELKSNRQLMFVDWIPTGIKIARTRHRLVHDEENQHYNNPLKSLLKISNHTSIFKDLLDPIINDFRKLISQRSYLFWYIAEGMEEGEFQDCEEKLESARAAYSDLQNGNLGE